VPVARNRNMLTAPVMTYANSIGMYEVYNMRYYCYCSHIGQHRRWLRGGQQLAIVLYL
jgi:hypothetical protein